MLSARARLLPSAREPGKWILLRRRSATEPTIRIAAKAIVLVAFLLVAEDAEGARDHLEGLVGVLMAVLVGMREQRLLAVGLLHVAFGAFSLQVEDLVEGCFSACSDPYHGCFLLWCVLPLRIPLVVLCPVPGITATSRIGPRCCRAGHDARLCVGGSPTRDIVRIGVCLGPREERQNG
jgi:hypothetical protein